MNSLPPFRMGMEMDGSHVLLEPNTRQSAVGITEISVLPGIPKVRQVSMPTGSQGM